MTQQEVLEAIYNAHTLAEISRAKQIVDAWLKDHPEDQEVLGTSEQPIRTRSALEELE